MHENFIGICGGKIKKEKLNSQNVGALEKIRIKHPNAYRKWTTEEESQVISQFKSGQSVKNISALSGRKVGGIRARLIKLGLVEP